MTFSTKTARAGLCALTGMILISLSGCASIAGAEKDNPAPQRTITERTASDVVTMPRKDRDSALRLARMLVAQGRLEGALGVYAELDRKGGMDAKSLLEYAGVASLIKAPRATLPLFARAEALAQAEKVELTKTEEGGLYAGLGRAYMAAARMTEAKTALERAVAADPNNIAARNALGVLLDAEGDHEGAAEQLNAALKLSPANIQVLNNLALSRMGAGDVKGALKALRDAESFTGANAGGDAQQGELTVKLNLAFIEFMTGAAERAEKTLAGFINDEQTAELLSRFAAMKTRIDAGESSLAEECLRASGEMLQIRAKHADDADDYGYEVPMVVSPMKIEGIDGASGAAGAKSLSPKARTLPNTPAGRAEAEGLMQAPAAQ